MSDPVFPAGFLWGTATSSHQVEGDNERNDWCAWEREPGRIRDGTVSGSAAEWWRGRAEEDLSRAAALGQNAHRLSLEWSRLEPEQGRWDDAAEARYREIFRHARGLGLKLSITLNHFTLPQWLARRGSWLAAEAPNAFGAFAQRAVEAFDEFCELWATFNEPNVLVYQAYAGKQWPPGRGDLKAGLRAFGALLDAHAHAYRAIRNVRPKSQVGIVLSFPAFEPASRSVADHAVTAIQSWAFSGAFMSALRTGRLLPPLGLGVRTVPNLEASLDWLGVNYYGRYRVAFDWSAYGELFGKRLTEHNVHTPWTVWGERSPEGLTEQLLSLGYYGVPLYVTENGLMTHDDAERSAFLLDHVRAVRRAIERGADVRGYFHWSLLDNFEWAEGWSTPFGLHALERATQVRTLRESGALYERICRANAVVP
jgi:beta-glucosidase